MKASNNSIGVTDYPRRFGNKTPVKLSQFSLAENRINMEMRMQDDKNELCSTRRKSVRMQRAFKIHLKFGARFAGNRMNGGGSGR